MQPVAKVLDSVALSDVEHDYISYFSLPKTQAYSQKACLLQTVCLWTPEIYRFQWEKHCVRYSPQNQVALSSGNLLLGYTEH